MKKNFFVTIVFALCSLFLAGCVYPIGTNPTNGATDVPLYSVISITFSGPMDASTITTSNIIVQNGLGSVAGHLSYVDSTNTVVFTPAENLSRLTTYTVTVKQDVKDTSGATMGFDYVFTFTTADVYQDHISYYDSGMIDENTYYLYAPTIMFDKFEGLYKYWACGGLCDEEGHNCNGDNIFYKEATSLEGLADAPLQYALTPSNLIPSILIPQKTIKFDNTDPCDPSVIQLDNGDYYLYYGGVDGYQYYGGINGEKAAE